MTRASFHLRANALVGAWLVTAVLATLVHRAVPAAGWLMVHLLLLGAVSTAILVWSQHFADTLLRRPAPGGRRGHAVRLAVHTVGSVLVVAGLVSSVWALVVAGGALVAGGAVTHVVVLVRQGRGALPSRFGPMVRYYVVASALLPVGVTLGVLMARGDLPDEVHGRAYVAHVALNLLGWVGITVLGTLVVLWPTVLHARIDERAEAAGPRALPVLVAGLGVVGAGAATGWRPLVGVGCLVVVAGCGVLVRSMVDQARDAAPRTYAAWTVGAAVAWLVACTLAYGAIVATAPSWADAVDRVRVLVAPFAVGFAAQVLVGSLSYLLSVVLGGGPATARRTAAELDRGALVRLVLVNGGLALYVAPVPAAVRVVCSLVVLGALVTFLVLALRAVVLARRAGPPVPVPRPAGAVPAVEVPRPHRSGAAAVGVGVLALVVALGVALDPPAAGIGLVSAADADGVAATGETRTVRVEAHDMRFSPDRIEVTAGDRLVIELVNTDPQTVHDLTLATGATTGRLAPGDSATLDVGVVGRSLEAWCAVAGHRYMGMTLDVVAVGGATVTADDGADPADPGAETAQGGRAGHGAAGTAGTSAAADLDLMAAPDDAFVARDATAPAPLPAGRTHRRTLTVQEVEREVAPGVTQTLWTFDGTAPGPVLRGQVGDTFEITLVNDGSIGHSIDFHAGELVPDDTMRTIPPGESLTFSFTATRSGIWMYHCSTMPMSLHIANGMSGAVIVDPPGLPAVDHEYVLVQSELYLGPQGGVADPEKIAARTPDLVVLNGYAHQYRDRPLEVTAGDRVRFWVLDAGPNRPSAFHVVGTQFDTLYREGDWVLRDGGSTGTGGAQVLALAPAEGGFVELTVPQPGTYPFVSHAMSDAEAGASGRLVVTAP
ncbi:multicopper oxidase domain-containing protein [Cellulomonas fimi]|uniref:Copper-containing nitrite reductase n=1 Tax=Cellulomonas fimi (strain ATCC 484 / DSM 20113 / JCM 1341 / CCUG 24087 / LMG 16345 / NBRC 15513 / NCIMB 8980 / NCTC 7547 / NRS-133) TaxID=590998 RepID=F4H4Z3_CELFA|nr:multicopper oxidase domain-containing protein [Cellulomonas fimi]AEE45473.1 Nitrite reductase (NO-forming) [Cellulomonas fimi ATCC 484]NNH07301.1 multicopper oxidase domain-containing protein [Cellulomonas fimi]VEH29520.1 Copper-containing nitrite reductase precursor [Cellulomonas fimi]